MLIPLVIILLLCNFLFYVFFFLILINELFLFYFFLIFLELFALRVFTFNMQHILLFLLFFCFLLLGKSYFMFSFSLLLLLLFPLLVLCVFANCLFRCFCCCLSMMKNATTTRRCQRCRCQACSLLVCAAHNNPHAHRGERSRSRTRKSRSKRQAKMLLGRNKRTLSVAKWTAKLYNTSYAHTHTLRHTHTGSHTYCFVLCKSFTKLAPNLLSGGPMHLQANRRRRRRRWRIALFTFSPPLPPFQH